MITIHTLAHKLNKPTTFRSEYVIIRSEDEALLNQQGVPMLELLSVMDPRNEVFDLLEELEEEATGNKKPKIERVVPVTYQRALTAEMYSDKPLMKFVARFATRAKAQLFMKQKGLWYPKFKIVKEARLKACARHNPKAEATGRLLSKQKDWARRGVLVPVGHFKGVGTLHKFHHRNRMMRDQAYAHFRAHGVLNPSRSDVNELFNAQSAPLPR